MAENFITDEDASNITADEVKFIFSHSEDLLMDVNQNGDKVGDRSSALMLIGLGFIVGLFGYAMTNFGVGQPDPLKIAGFLTASYLTYHVLKLGENLLPTLYYSVGAAPKDFFAAKIFKGEVTDKRLNAIILNEIREYQTRIEENRTTNETRWTRYRHAYIGIKRVIFVIPISYAVGWGVKCLISALA